MIITKRIDRRQLVKLLNGMYNYIVTIIFDESSNEIKICDNKTTVSMRVEQ